MQNEKKGQSGTHSAFVTNVEIYNKSSDAASASRNPEERLDTKGIVDIKLQSYFDSANSSSKILDENWEPLSHWSRR